MDVRGKKVLVTGAGGFIGSHLIEELVLGGAQVRAFVHYNARSDIGNLAHVAPEVRDQMEIVFGDVRDPFMVRKAVQSQDVVFHLAALIGIPYSYHAPHSYVETNVHGTLNVMQAALEAGVTRVVHTSTSEVYGTAQYVPIDEAHPLQTQSPYSATKVGADSMAWSYYLSFGLPVAIIRPFNAFGPRQSARAIIPTIFSQLVARSETLRVGSLTPLRDFNYVKDLARAFVALAAADAAVGEVTNVGSGEEVTIAELVEQCCAIAGYRPRLEVEAARVRPERSEVMRLWCDNSKVTKITGWHPQGSLAAGLRATFEFVAAHSHLFEPRRYAV